MDGLCVDFMEDEKISKCVVPGCNQPGVRVYGVFAGITLGYCPYHEVVGLNFFKEFLLAKTFTDTSEHKRRYDERKRNSREEGCEHISR